MMGMKVKPSALREIIEEIDEDGVCMMIIICYDHDDTIMIFYDHILTA